MKAESKQLQQGSSEWHYHRMAHLNASDAAAMLGMSKYKTRAELLREKATGIVPDVDERTQRLFDRGHEIEALARPWAEAVIGAELYPVVLAAEVDGLPLSASLDGLTMLEDSAWECKSANNGLVESLSNGVIPGEYWPQMEQGLMLSGADRCLFTASDGTEEGTLHVWYESNPDVRKQLLAGWKQFSEDLANYQHQDAPKVVTGEVIEGLPALVIQVEGRITATNMDAFRAAAETFLGRLPQADALETDQDFANAETAAKTCKETEARIKVALEQARAQAADVDAMFRVAETIGETIRAARIQLEKTVDARKQDIRAKKVRTAQDELAAHIKRLNDRLGGQWMPVVEGEFQAAIKGKRTIAGLEEGICQAMANAKIRANEIADTIQVNVNLYAGQYASAAWLAPDFKAICTKAPEDFANLMVKRALEHDEAVRKQEADRLMKEQQAAQAAAQDNGWKPAETTQSAQSMHERPQATAASTPTINPGQAVIDAEPTIRAFLASREWKRGEETKARAVLVEFVKFQSIHKEK